MLELRVPFAFPVAPLPLRHQTRGGADQTTRKSERCHSAVLGRSRDAASSCRMVCSAASSAFTPVAVSS